MPKYECPICEKRVKIKMDLKPGQRVTCTNCNAQLVLVLDGPKKKLRCAFCNKDTIECSPDCETRILEKKKLGFFDIKLE